MSSQNEEKNKLALVLQQGERLSLLVNDIMDYNLLQEGRLRIHPRPIHPSVVLENVLSILESQIDHSRIEIVKRIPHDIPPAMADPDRLEQIFYNLIGNSLRATPRGKITVSLFRRADSVEIQIQDEGEGMTPEEIQQLFEPSSRTGEFIKGMGLGFLLTRELVRLHGDDLRVSSEKDRGTEISFSLPVSKENPDKINGSDRHHPVPYPATEVVYPRTLHTGAPEGKILVVDDDATMLSVMEVYLRDLSSYEIHFHQNSQEALELAKKESFDLLILDVLMPGISGYDFCREIRKTKPAHISPVLLVTALVGSDHFIKGFNSGANDFLNRPFTKEELLGRSLTLIQAARTQMERQLQETRIHEARNRERNQIFRDLHDHLGGKLVDLGLQIDGLKARGISDEEVRPIEENLESTRAFLRQEIQNLEDRQLLEEDFLEGLHMLLLRRYVRANRTIDFRTDDTSRSLLESGISDHFIESILPVILEISTNDLKYGENHCTWNFHLDGEHRLRIEMKSKSLYSGQKYRPGNGSRNIQRRIASGYCGSRASVPG